ncbi:MAG: hypothetical protein V5A25_00975 [Halovenus sp.]
MFEPGRQRPRMINAKFRIQLPDHIWVAELSREFPRSTFNLLSGYGPEDRALELGVDKSTPSTVLRHGESRLLKWHLTGTQSDRLG